MGAASRQRSSPLLIRSSRFFDQKRHSNASAPPLQPGPGPQRLSSLSTIEVLPQGQPIRRRRGGAMCHDTGAEGPIFRGLQGVLPIVDPTVAPVHRARGRLLRRIIT
nr:unnamed protein product [Callosobruchus chinensis]